MYIHLQYRVHAYYFNRLMNDRELLTFIRCHRRQVQKAQKRAFEDFVLQHFHDRGKRNVLQTPWCSRVISVLRYRCKPLEVCTRVRFQVDLSAYLADISVSNLGSTIHFFENLHGTHAGQRCCYVVAAGP